MPGLRAGFGLGHSSKTLQSGQSALLCLRVGSATQPGRGKPTHESEGSPRPSRVKLKTESHARENVWATTIPRPSHSPQRNKHLPSPKGGLEGFHLLCVPPSKCQSHLSVRSDWPGSSQEGDGTQGSALREDASASSAAKVFPISSDVAMAREMVININPGLLPHSLDPGPPLLALTASSRPEEPSQPSAPQDSRWFNSLQGAWQPLVFHLI